MKAKKLFALALAAAMSLTTLASCGKTESDDKDSSKDTKETTAATTTAATTVESDTVLTTTAVYVEAPSDMKTDGSYTKNFNQSMDSGKYTMELSYSILGMEIPMKIVTDGKSAYMEVTNSGVTAKMYLTDGKLYTLEDTSKQYSVEDYADDIEAAMGLNLYDDTYTFTKTEATQLDGVDYYAEHFTYSDATLGDLECIYYFDPTTEALTKLSMISAGSEVLSMAFTKISDEIDESLLKLPDLSSYTQVEATE